MDKEGDWRKGGEDVGERWGGGVDTTDVNGRVEWVLTPQAVRVGMLTGEITDLDTRRHEVSPHRNCSQAGHRGVRQGQSPPLNTLLLS